MRKILIWFLKTFLFWTLVFQIGRLVFSLYEWPQTSAYGITTIMKSFYHGIHQDFSASGYITMLNGLFLWVILILGMKRNRIFFKVLNSFLMVVVTIVTVVDSELYRNWGVHMDATPLLFLKTPKDALASTTLFQMFFILVIMICMFISIFWIYRKLFKTDIVYVKRKKSQRYSMIVSVLLVCAVMIIPIRGGFGIAPMNTGTVYFSKDLYPNHLAVNSSWNFLYSVSKMNKFAKPYNFMPNEKAKAIREDIFRKSAPRHVVLKEGQKPNVLLILMESFTGKMVGALGYKEYTPNLTRISKEGVLFNHIYSTGDRSDRGIVGVISGYPSEPTASIMKYPEKSQKLPFVTKVLKDEGYSADYYYGGDTDFANMHSYLTNAGFDRVIDMTYFDPKDYNSKWGVHDGIMLDYFLKDINKAAEDPSKPFFKMLFTLSSHEPFEVPMETVISGNSEQNKFLNSVTYSDRCLGKFYDEAKKQPWFKNTLIVFVADHGHRLPYNTKANDPKKYHIPLILAGGLVKQDSIVTKCGSNTDVPATILGQLGLPNNEFNYSKDLMDPNSSSFGYFVYNGGVGACVDSSKIVFDLNTQKVSYKENYDQKNLEKIQAVLQSAWNTFLGNEE
ncbi:sulfatase-like hydrolase/transferase [Halosquirtibacter laminarini]|uniref:Sulfatase-like hydrolase/transferase n=1 Tax=Halosquirtibacter laminarini TaxID=3374600 RepID=A0AC61NPP6_9BACT|nr:sulfatase-like hydrolase/transferase [Prolixibacteraceae bacterium]